MRSKILGRTARRVGSFGRKRGANNNILSRKGATMRAAQVRRSGYRRMGAIGGAGAMMMGGRDSSPRTSPTPRSSGGMGYTPGRSSGGRM